MVLRAHIQLCVTAMDILEKVPIWQKITHPHNSGSVVIILLEFCTIKGANRQMKLILIIFSKQKKNVLGKWTILGPKIVHTHNSRSAVRICLRFCTMKRANRSMKVIIMVCAFFLLFRTNELFQAGKQHILIALDRLKEFFKKFYRMKRANRQMKILLVVF